MPKIITSEFLETHRACADQVALFARLYPEGAELVLGSIIRAAKQGLTVDWLRQFLPASARCAYDEARASAWRAYEEAIAPARRAYYEAIALTWCAYNEARAPARRAYDEARAAAERAYDIACASILEKHLSELIAA